MYESQHVVFLPFFYRCYIPLNGNVIIDATCHKWIHFHHKNLKILLKSWWSPPSLLKYSYFSLNKCFFIQKVVIPYFLSLPFLKPPTFSMQQEQKHGGSCSTVAHLLLLLQSRYFVKMTWQVSYQLINSVREFVIFCQKSFCQFLFFSLL